MRDLLDRHLHLDLDGQAGLQPQQAGRPGAHRPRQPGPGLRRPPAHRPVRDRGGRRAPPAARRHPHAAGFPAGHAAAAAAGGDARRGRRAVAAAAARLRGGQFRKRGAQELQPLPRAGPRDQRAGRAGRAADAPLGDGRPAAARGRPAWQSGLGERRLPAAGRALLPAVQAATPDQHRGRDLPGRAGAARRPRARPRGGDAGGRAERPERCRRGPDGPLRGASGAPR